jgi:tRNA(fMet)-specific endonuclease VapC
MMVVLDTDHLSILEWGGPPSEGLRERLGSLEPGEAFATIVSFEEQTRGWLTFMSRARKLAAQVEAYRRLKRHLDNYRSMPVLDFDAKAAAEYDDLRRQKLRIGTVDMKIAAIALANDATLLTRNRLDFKEVRGLKFEDWTR